MTLLAVCARQIMWFGVLAAVGCRRAELEPHIGEVCTASVACGVMGYGGNKGAAAVSFSLFRRRLVLVSSHFAAHQVGVCGKMRCSGCSNRCRGAGCPCMLDTAPPRTFDVQALHDIHHKERALLLQEVTDT